MGKALKKTTTMIAAFLMLISCAACSASGGAKANKDMAFTLEGDVGINIDGTWYPTHCDAALLLEALGPDHETFAAPSCVYEGEDKEFRYEHVSILTNPAGDTDVWYSMEITGDEFPTARGIKVGDTKEELIEAYGEGYYMESDYQMTYSVSGQAGDIGSPCLIFDIEDDIITKIAIYYATNV